MTKEKCKGCGKCCKYVAIEIDKPETKEDFENIKWYVIHKGVKVFQDVEENWFVEFSSHCKFLKSDNLCGIYDKRPSVCRGYDADTCLNNNEDYEEKVTFNNLKDVEEYVKKKFED